MATDYPLEEIADTLEPLVAAGCTFIQKWTCRQCGVRKAMVESNKLFTKGHCDECDVVTDLVEQGCNYMLITSI